MLDLLADYGLTDFYLELSTRDPEKFPVCPECKRVYETLKPGE